MKSNKGQSVMEYVILTSLIGIFCLVAIKQFGETVKVRIQKMKAHVVRYINIG